MITSLRSRSPGEERWGGKRGRKQRERESKSKGRGGLSRIAIRGWIESVKERTNESGGKGVWNI